MKLYFSIGLLAFGLFPACTTVTMKSADDRPITRDYTLDGFRWNSNDGVVAAVFKIFEVGGKVSLCGAYSYDVDREGGPHALHDQALSAMRIDLGSEILVNDISYFNKFSFPASGFPTGKAACVVTDRAWTSQMNDSLKPELKIAKKRFVVYG